MWTPWVSVRAQLPHVRSCALTQHGNTLTHTCVHTPHTPAPYLHTHTLHTLWGGPAPLPPSSSSAWNIHVPPTARPEYPAVLLVPYRTFSDLLDQPCLQYARLRMKQDPLPGVPWALPWPWALLVSEGWEISLTRTCVSSCCFSACV